MTSARRSLAALAAAVLTTGAAPAYAAPIDNPGLVDLEWPGTGYSPFLDFASGHALLQTDTQVTLDVLSDGSFAFVGAVTTYESLSPSVSVSAQVLQAQLQIIDAYGYIDGSTGDWDITLSARVRFKTVGAAVPATCATGFFDIQLIEQSPTAGQIDFTLDPSEPFVIPTVSAAACGGAANAAAINAALQLGGGAPAFQFYKVRENPPLFGS